MIVCVCVFKQDPSISKRAKPLRSRKEFSEVCVREGKDLIFYSEIDENHFCHLLELERSDEYRKTSGPEIILAKVGQLFYKDGTYT